MVELASSASDVAESGGDIELGAKLVVMMDWAGAVDVYVAHS